MQHFSNHTLLVLLYFLYFSIYLLLLEYVKLDNSICYQVLVKVCMFLIIFIFIILSMFVCVLYFCRIYRRKKNKKQKKTTPFAYRTSTKFILKFNFLTLDLHINTQTTKKKVGRRRRLLITSQRHI